MSTHRRVVTVVFADLVDFTVLSERLDAEDVARVQDVYFAAAARAVSDAGGRLEKFIGDAVVATFGTPSAADDDAERAVRAARLVAAAGREVEQSLGLEPGTVRVRVGVNTGEVVVSGPDGRVTGDTVNTAARLQAAAEPDSVLLGPETAFAVAHAVVLEAAGDLALKGKAAPVAAWRVVGDRTAPARGLGQHGLGAPVLGRSAEIALVLEHLARASRTGSEGVLVVAPPGVGKTRLAAEVAAAVPGHPTWTARLTEVPGAGYQAVAALLADALGDADAQRAVERLVTARLAAGDDAATAGRHAGHAVALLAGEPLHADPSELFTSWVAVLDALPEDAAAAPVWFVEDLHLASPDLLAFLQEALNTPRPGGRLMVLTSRPAGIELHGATTVHLPPLDPTATQSLVHLLIGDAVPDPYVDGIVRASGGNPLFVEELLRSWIQLGALRRTATAWEFSGTTPPSMPSTVQAIYQGQLDALHPAAREVVERGAVPGTTFPAAALPALGSPSPDAPLTDLARSGLLHGPHAEPLGGDGFTFRHALLRDAAYGSLARQDRAELHLRFARWLAERPGPAVPDLVAGHLAIALEARPATVRTLGGGLTAEALATEAAEWHERAARHHLVASPQQAAALAGRALALAPDAEADVVLRRRLLHAEALRRSGHLPDAMAAFADAGAAAEALGSPADLLAAGLGYEDSLFASRLPRSTWGATSVQLLTAAERALPRAEHAPRSRALAALGRALGFEGRRADAAAAAGEAVRLAERSGDPGALAAALLTLRSTTPVPLGLAERLEAGERATAAAGRTEDLELQLETARLHLLDLLEAGDVAAADRVQAHASALVARLGRPLHAWYPPMWAAMRALLAEPLDRAAELVDAAADAARRAHYADGPLVHAIQRLDLHLQRGTPERVRSEITELAAAVPGRWAFAAALVHATLGDHVAARAYLEFYTDEDFANVPEDLARATTMAGLAEAVALLGDAAAAARLAELLAPWAGHVIVLGAGALCLGSASHHLALCLRTAGDAEGARRHLRDAIGQNEAIGALRFAARSRAELAATGEDGLPRPASPRDTP